MNPRKPTKEEKNELIHFLVENDYGGYEEDKETAEGIVENAAIAVFDDYATGSPGYVGKVMVVVYDGGTEQTETYSWNTLDRTKSRDVAIHEV
ncbi:hypothetical protein KSF_084260 [Reticulibacter mediterranei]|uniref:Uncharacterized protein n=1 Tax=Reticulibacter mediterranei TaxID=2778369 RepID=A0A8J3N796_9CHLR|nr:hypothetical protein [Reticulibacter mediterranei]GHO98378.1 hypothetical protein KSF_084260 [Reticulibacter mediterranei]